MKYNPRSQFVYLYVSRSPTSWDQGLLIIPGSKLTKNGEGAFEVVAHTLWNSLQLDKKWYSALNPIDTDSRLGPYEICALENGQEIWS